MTFSELLKKGIEALLESEVDNAENEARWLLEEASGYSSSRIFSMMNELCPKNTEKLFLEKIRERKNGRPVQYIIGHWDFCGREFFVGEGVLIPRPETEILVDFALEKIKDIKNPVVIDLCAGSGCIGLTIAAERPDAKVYLVEKYDAALNWLEKNRQSIAPCNTVVVKGDVLTELCSLGLPKCDVLLSNPPYINSSDISSLQSEVLREPVTALDGGSDGLMFYRAIASALPDICKGVAAFECGENQWSDIEKLFARAGHIKDFNDTERVVYTYVSSREEK